MFCRSVQYCLPKITSYPVLLHVNKQELCSVKAPLLSKGLLSHELAANPIIFKIVLCPGTLRIDALKFHFAMTVFTKTYLKNVSSCSPTSLKRTWDPTVSARELRPPKTFKASQKWDFEILWQDEWKPVKVIMISWWFTMEVKNKNTLT